MATAILSAPPGITPATARTAPAPGFTAGPWHEHSHRRIGPDGGTVCEVWSAVGSDDDDAITQADANCRLIAAAPELHQALVEIMGDYRNDLALLRPRTLQMVVFALAKANGGAA